MIWRGKTMSIIISILSVFLIFLFPDISFSQIIINGKVIYQKDAAPAVHANIELLNHQGGTITNQEGDFSYTIKNIKSNDTLLISSVGYENIKIPVSAALVKSQFVLVEKVKNLEPVTVFNSHEVVGSTSESIGFYRSWSYNTGGEIGRIFTLPYDKFKIDKIRFKAGNLCDTCLLRLHIREVDKGLPGNEILNDSISLVINKLSLDSKIPEFDLTPYDITFTRSEFFVGIEVLNCTAGKNESSCSFSFAGTDKGEYIYKSRANKDWETASEYTIYLKLFLRY